MVACHTGLVTRCVPQLGNIRFTQDSFFLHTIYSKLPNALPYIGAYLDQIYALEMNSKTYNADGLVNFAKMTKLAQMIQNVLQYQKSRFGFEPRLDVSQLIPITVCFSNQCSAQYFSINSRPFIQVEPLPSYPS